MSKEDTRHYSWQELIDNPSLIFSKERAKNQSKITDVAVTTKKPDLSRYVCETNMCMNPATVRYFGEDYVTGMGKDNDIYLCIQHANRLRNMMNVDINKMNKRRVWQKQNGLR